MFCWMSFCFYPLLLLLLLSYSTSCFLFLPAVPFSFFNVSPDTFVLQTSRVAAQIIPSERLLRHLTQTARKTKRGRAARLCTDLRPHICFLWEHILCYLLFKKQETQQQQQSLCLLRSCKTPNNSQYYADIITSLHFFVNKTACVCRLRRIMRRVNVMSRF